MKREIKSQKGLRIASIIFFKTKVSSPNFYKNTDYFIVH